MLPRWADPRSRAFTIALGATAGLLVVFIVLYPEHAFQASLNGLTLWWKLVFPALMPFAMLTELLAGFGVLHAAGELFDRPLRRLFGLPGAGGYALAVGLLGGYPAGADAVAKLRGSGLIGGAEAERLFALTHVCNPVTMVTVVGVGMLHSPEAGVIVAVAHYIAALLTALLLPRGTPPPHDWRAPTRSLPVRAAGALIEARRLDGRTFGKLLGDAVLSSIQTLLMLGGFIMLFSVFHQVARLLVPMLNGGGIADAAAGALLEPHIGANGLAANVDNAPLLWRTALIGAALGWSGLAQHAQVLSLARAARVRFAPFFAARCLHAVLAFGLTFALWHPLARLLHWSVPSFSAATAAADSVMSERFPLAGYPEALRLLLPLLPLLAAAAIGIRALRIFVQR